MIPVESKTIPENILKDSVLAHIAAVYFSLGRQLERKTRCSSTRGFILSTLPGGASLNQNQIARFRPDCCAACHKVSGAGRTRHRKKAATGRAILVSLSAKGSKYSGQLIKARVAADQKVREALTTEERSTLLRLLHQLAALEL
jgi:hypothetical protein